MDGRARSSRGCQSAHRDSGCGKETQRDTETQVRCGKGLLEVRLGLAGRGALEGFLGQRSNLNRALKANSAITEPTFNVDLIFLFIS